jgi:hypothetical protein
MFVAVNETAVSLDALDPYLKAILKTKLREFVYLHPCFQNTPSFDARGWASRRQAAGSRMNSYDLARLQYERDKVRLERLYLESLP